ncbi:MAG: isochorismate synthase [Proteobacteria bacterium]|nr:isochorismate synthase [Pseudomonadota bacterium]
MQSATPEPVGNDVADAVRHALAQARPEAPAYLRLIRRLPTCDPWVVARALQRPGEDFFLWRDGRTGRCFAGLGQAAEVLVAPDPQRLAQARAAAVTLALRTTQLATAGTPATAEEGLPFLLGGFAFGQTARPEGADAGGPWRGWPNGRLVLPSVLLARQERGPLLLVLSEAVASGASAGDVIARLEQQRARIEAAAAAASARANAPTPLPLRSAQQTRAAQATPHDSLLPAPEAWLAQARRACADIAGGEAHKIVLARAAHWAARGGRHADLWGTLSRLRRDYGDCTIYALGRADGSILFGASPETLVELRGDQVSTVALAGTGARHGDPSRDEDAAQALAASVKERAEHRLVVRAIKQALRPWCGELTLAAQPQVRKLPLLQHLETPLRGRLARPAHVLQLVAELHPTPAVAGWPTEAALGWLARHEGIERGWYAGPLGWCDLGGDGHFVVALRCALSREDQLWAFAGAGLTQRSTPLGEWEETRLKLRTIAEALAWTEPS